MCTHQRVDGQLTAAVKPVSKIKSERLNIRTSREEKDLVEQAARATRVTSSRFVLQAAVKSAEEVLADQTKFVLQADKWGEFTALLDRPVQEIPALKEAVSKPTPFGER
jgi:uncharacterized protein (DUF1778 family)